MRRFTIFLVAAGLLLGCGGQLRQASVGDPSVVISPPVAYVHPGEKTTFTASLSNGQASGMYWEVEPGGGTIDVQGESFTHYTAPHGTGVYQLKATSTVYQRQSQTASITITAPPEVSVSIAPASVSLNPGQSQRFTATVTGTADPSVAWRVLEPGGGTVAADGLYTAPSAAGTYHVAATSVADPTKSAQATATVTSLPPPVTVAILPPGVILAARQTQAFTATVTGTSNPSVVWNVVEPGGGTITTAGLYTAPGQPGSFHVAATSVADPSRSAQALVTVQAPDGPSLGVLLDAIADWAAPFYADLVKSARPWSLPGTLGADPVNWVPVDSNGWPTSDASLFVASPMGRLPLDRPFRLSFAGRADVRLNGAPVGGLTYDLGQNRTSGDLWIPHVNVLLDFVNTHRKRPGDSPDEAGVTEVKLLRPGHGEDELFDRDLLARASHFSTIRFMVPMGSASAGAPDNPCATWAHRRLPSHPIQEGEWDTGSLTSCAIPREHTGIALEHIVLFANRTGKDLWINLPVFATDEYVTQLAQFLLYGSDGVNPYTSPQVNPVYPPLDSGLKVYIEYVNELWNSQNGEYLATMRNAALAEEEILPRPWQPSTSYARDPLRYQAVRNGGNRYVCWIGGTSASSGGPTGTGMRILDGTVVWNYAGPAPAGTDPHHLDSPPPRDLFGHLMRRQIHRTMEISNVLRAVAGDANMHTRFRPVFASAFYFASARGDAQLTDVLSWFDQHYGAGATGHPMNYYFYGIATAWYAGDTLNGDPRTGEFTVDQLFDQAFAEARSYGYDHVDGWAQAAARYNLKLLAYEGGQGFDRPGSIQAKLQAQEDPRMAELIRLQWTKWQSVGGGLWNWTSLCTGWAGTPDDGPAWWGLSDHMDREDTLKWRTIKEILAGR